ncbi:DEKNAAC104714 [Brettanomyces naardenensis]|uniref:Probable 26S proteasome regulatory subunit p27 n=1 Tax=Brettanomyces naardenensis TaxID=13370 RepID=A0A448YRK7_BRENA|nr:DEKNAAC104714 [Brettanomyces naardenensis]
MSFENAMKDLNMKAVDYDLEVVRAEYDLGQLTGLKKEIESSLVGLFDKLTKELGTDMDAKVVTADGFPRNDLDIVQVRLVRVQIIRLRNDLKEILGLLETKVAERFQEINSGHATGSDKTVDLTQLIPFATVEELAVSGPADEAGLRVGDRILRFGNVDVTNHRSLLNLAPVVRNNVGGKVEIVVQREESEDRLVLELSPSNSWGGRGLLGCKLVEIK